MRHRLYCLVVLTLLLFASDRLHAQQPAILGTITDADGVPVVDAAVTLVGPEAGTGRTLLSDRAGAYRFLNLLPGAYEIRVRRLGFVELRRTITLTAAEQAVVDLILATDTLRLERIVVEATPDRERERFDTEPGVTARVVEAASLDLLPGLAEPDVLRAIELLPGVISTSDFSGAYNVRGGSADQNLILLDGFTVFNPFHLGGLFSVFNSDAIERAELFAGGFSADFGGRVSSVLNIESRKDLPDGFQFEGGISMLSTRLLVRAPLPDPIQSPLGLQNGSWFVSGRRSYFDQLLRPVANFPYHLSDLQAYATGNTAGGGRLALTGYWGGDVLDLSDVGLADGGAADVLRVRWNWGNQLAGLTWTQPLEDWRFDARLGFSRFSDRLVFVDFGDVEFRSRIEQFIFRSDLSRQFWPALELRVGLAGERTDHANLASAGGTTFFDSDGVGLLGSAHVSVRWRPSPRWIVEPGARYDAWRASDATRSVISPRFAVKRFFGVGQDVALKLAIGRYAQFVHSLRDEELPLSNDTWILADRWVPHVVSDQVQAGIEAFWGVGWSGSLEAYLRRFDGVTEFNTAEDPNDPADDMLAGSSRSSGLDLMVRKDQGRLTGWTAISLLRADRTFPDPLAGGFDDLPQSVTFPPIFDRRVNVDVIAQYATTRDVEIGLRWVFGSGLPHTRPLAQYFAWRHNPTQGLAEPLEAGPDRNGLPVAVVLGPRNGERYPSYHRLDVTIRRTVERRWGSYVPYLQILNIYNRRNVLFFFYDYDDTPPTRSGFSMFPLLPAIGVEVSF